MCGSTDLLKQDGVFVCQSCGCKYSVEEARKMMVEGTVKIDNSDKLANLYTLARRARDEKNTENAEKYYAEIALEDPNSWEAAFYSVYYKVHNQKLLNAAQSINELNGCIKTTFQLIKQTASKEEWRNIYTEVSNKTLVIMMQIPLLAMQVDAVVKQQIVGYACLACERLGDLINSEFFDAECGAQAYKQALILAGPVNSEISNLPTSIIDRIFQKVKSVDPTYEMEVVENEFKEGTGSEIAVGKVQTGHDDIQIGWREGTPNSAGGNDVKISFRNDSQKEIKYIVFLTEALNAVGDVLPCTVQGWTTARLQGTGPYAPNATPKVYWENIWYNHSVKSARVVGIEIEFMDGEKVRISESRVKIDSTASGGCYVATAVYGSYDCPQVWTLRRFRDYTLAETWYGRAFIHAYYAISPTLVKWFGHTEWFKKMWKGKLDRMVVNLNAKGVENTPYEDRNW